MFETCPSQPLSERDRAFLSKITSHDLLSQAETQRLAAKVQAGCSRSRTEMVMRNQRLVVHLANRYRNSAVSFMDKITAANEGLLLAVDRYDSSIADFSTYAYWRIQERFQDAVYKSAAVKVPIKKAMRFFADRNKGKEHAESGFIGEAFRAPLSIGLGRSSEEGPELSLPDPEEDPFIAADASLMAERAMRLLSEGQKEVIALRYGLIDGIPRSQRETATAIGCSATRVANVEKEALKRMKKLLSS